jgi:hypothetical protein
MTETSKYFDYMREATQQMHRTLIEIAKEEFVAGTKVKWQVHSSGSADGFLRGEVLPHKEALQNSCLIAIKRTDGALKKDAIAFVDAYQLLFDIQPNEVSHEFVQPVDRDRQSGPGSGDPVSPQR